jgi:predicted PurR-regulated permease PerM
MPKAKSKTIKKLSLGQEILKVLGNYLATQFILMLLVGFATWGILNLLKVNYSILLAIITGTLSGVPGFGMTLAAIIAAVVAILDGSNMWTNSPGWLEALIVLVAFFVFNKIIDLIIAPIFLGKATKVHPLIVILLTLWGTIWLGIPDPK